MIPDRAWASFAAGHRGIEALLKRPRGALAPAGKPDPDSLVRGPSQAKRIQVGEGETSSWIVKGWRVRRLEPKAASIESKRARRQ